VRGLTARQEKLVRFIHEYTRQNQMPPTLRDMANHLGARSSAAAVDHLKALQKKGYVKRRAFASRGTVLTPEGLCLARDIDLRGQLG
jgi:repressor LexA